MFAAAGPGAGVPAGAAEGGRPVTAAAAAGGAYLVRVTGGAAGAYRLGVDLAVFDDYLTLGGAAAAFTRYAGSAAGYAVAVLDTGVDYTHPALAGRVVLGPDFGNGDADPMDTVGHGTHVAGIVAGGSGHAPGVAAGADVVAVKITRDGSLTAGLAAIRDALRWVRDNRARLNIVAVNLSFAAGSVPKGEGEAELDGLFAELAAAGVVVAAAAGNAHATYGGRDGVSRLAASPAVAAVGAVWDSAAGPATWSSGARDLSSGADRLTSFTQRGAGVGLVAPGGDILNLRLGGGLTVKSGTSMAAPFVAGAAAVVRAAADRLGLALSAADIVALLARTGAEVYDGDDEDTNQPASHRTYRRVDLAAALAALGVAPADVQTVLLDADPAGPSVRNFPTRPHAAASSDDAAFARSATEPPNREATPFGQAADLVPTASDAVLYAAGGAGADARHHRLRGRLDGRPGEGHGVRWGR